MSEIFRLGVAQLTSTDKFIFNLNQIEKLYTQANQEGAELIVFPENSLHFRILSKDAPRGVEWDGPEMREIQRIVDAGSAPLMLTTALQSGGKKLSNTTILFQAQKPGEILYHKIHLFDVDVPGAPPVRESDSFDNGNQPRIFEFNGWKFGMSICYDLRFSELYSRYAQKVDVILVPSAFLVPTGEAHWHVLLRARAIENQCFVAAPAQSGDHVSESQVRKTYGHSLVVDPWGKIMVELKESPQIRVVELNRGVIAQVRRQIPMSGHRRL